MRDGRRPCCWRCGRPRNGALYGAQPPGGNRVRVAPCGCGDKAYVIHWAGPGSLPAFEEVT